MTDMQWREPTWGHRVIKWTSTHGDEYFEIREVYYDRNGKIDGWTAEGIIPYGENLDELRETLEWMLKALEKPVLIESKNERGRDVLIEAE